MEQEVMEFVNTWVRERTQGDGGAVRAASCEGANLELVLEGECSVCPISETCLKQWVGDILQQRFGRVFQIHLSKKLAYFRDR